MKVVVIDGQGGRLGRMLVQTARKSLPTAEIIAVGTNSVATDAMMKGGADHGATGENAVRVNCRQADLILGPIGIVLADALYGEVTAAMASCVGASEAHRILLPVSRCGTTVVGAQESNMARLLEMTERLIADWAREQG